MCIQGWKRDSYWFNNVILIKIIPYTVNQSIFRQMTFKPLCLFETLHQLHSVCKRCVARTLIYWGVRAFQRLRYWWKILLVLLLLLLLLVVDLSLTVSCVTWKCELNLPKIHCFPTKRRFRAFFILSMYRRSKIN